MRRLRLLGHPLHPPLTDFPLVLLCLAPLADGWARFGGDAVFSTVGFWCLCGGLVAALPAAVTGFLDFATIPSASPAAQTAMWHLMLMLSAVSISGLGLLFRADPLGFWLEAAGAMLVGVGGWFGGHLVFGHGVGVRGESNDRP